MRSWRTKTRCTIPINFDARVHAHGIEEQQCHVSEMRTAANADPRRRRSLLQSGTSPPSAPTARPASVLLKKGGIATTKRSVAHRAFAALHARSSQFLRHNCLRYANVQIECRDNIAQPF